MKVIIIALLAVGAFSLSLENVDFTLLLQEGSSSNDAVQAVYNLLQDLKQANLEAQAMADRKNVTDEDIGAKVVRELTKVQEMNRQAWQEAKDHRDWVEAELVNAINYVKWAEGRIVEIDRRSTSLEELRCFSNSLFVRSIKQHQDALSVLRTLKQDVSGYITGQPSSLAELKVENVADKLKMYSNLFNQKAMESFAELATKQASGGAELHAMRDDEQFTGTKPAGEDARAPGDNIGQQIYNLILDLEDQLRNSLQVLEENEIAAAYHLADWLADSEAEKANLSQEIQKKTAYQDKLQLSHNAALAQQAKANSVLTESRAAVNQAITDLQEKRDFWQAEFNRRNEENAVIDEIVFIFKQQVKDMVSGTSYGRK